MIIHKILLITFLLITTNLYSQEISTLKKDSLSKILYQHASDDTPGMAVGIVKDGKIIYENYVGYSNLEHKIKIDKNTRFNIASNAKQFTALCILKLIEERKVKLEDDIRKYLPDLYKDVEHVITVSHLLTHTSGVRDYGTLIALQGQDWWQLFIDNEDVVKLLEAQKGLNFKSGTDYLYSNSNYILLAEIVKKVTNQEFSKFARTIFEELDMPNTNYLTNYMTVIPHKARPYGNWNGWKEYPSITGVHGDGALFTTLQDQLKWEQIIQLNDGKYLSKKLIDKSQALIENSIDTYGYGLEFRDYNGLDYTYHDGSTGAYHATFLRFPTKKVSIVVMGNSGPIPSNYTAWQIAKLILELKGDKDKVYPKNPDKIEKLRNIQEVLGIYKGEDNGTIIRIVEKDGSLYREIYQRDPVKLIQEKNGLFEYEAIKDLKMNFTNVGKANQQFTLYKSTQKPSNYHKISNSDMSSFDKSELNGRFYNDETDTEIIIKYLEGNTYSLTKNGREREAELILKDYLRMMEVYKIKIIRDKENKVIGLNVDRDRIRNVIFIKIK